MKIHAPLQGSQEWLELRCGIPTASEFGQLLTPALEPRRWSTEMPHTYLAKKLAEKWGGPLPGFSSWATEQGQFVEEKAYHWYTFEYGQQVQRVGFCTSDDGRIGCSPDGLLGDDGGIEIKCPEPTQHVKYLLGGELPEKYAPQVHGSMLVTGRPWWRFLSYRQMMPKFVLQVNRDAAIESRIADAVGEFIIRFDKAWARLVEFNDGPPPKREVMVFADDIAAGRAEDPTPYEDDIAH